MARKTGPFGGFLHGSKQPPSRVRREDRPPTQQKYNKHERMQNHGMPTKKGIGTAPIGLHRQPPAIHDCVANGLLTACALA